MVINLSAVLQRISVFHIEMSLPVIKLPEECCLEYICLYLFMDIISIFEKKALKLQVD